MYPRHVTVHAAHSSIPWVHAELATTSASALATATHHFTRPIVMP